MTPDSAHKILEKAFGEKLKKTIEEFRSQYMQYLVRNKVHPDLGGSHEQFVTVNTAYEVYSQHLKDAQGNNVGFGLNTRDILGIQIDCMKNWWRMWGFEV